MRSPPQTHGEDRRCAAGLRQELTAIINQASKLHPASAQRWRGDPMRRSDTETPELHILGCKEEVTAPGSRRPRFFLCSLGYLCFWDTRPRKSVVCQPCSPLPDLGLRRSAVPVLQSRRVGALPGPEGRQLTLNHSPHYPVPGRCHNAARIFTRHPGCVRGAAVQHRGPVTRRFPDTSVVPVSSSSPGPPPQCAPAMFLGLKLPSRGTELFLPQRSLSSWFKPRGHQQRMTALGSPNPTPGSSSHHRAPHSPLSLFPLPSPQPFDTFPVSN